MHMYFQYSCKICIYFIPWILCIFTSVAYCSNRIIDHMVSNKEGSYEDVRYREGDEKCHRKKGQDIIIDDDSNKNPQVSCNYIVFFLRKTVGNLYIKRDLCFHILQKAEY
jgi:hypothetical protein